MRHILRQPARQVLHHEPSNLKQKNSQFQIPNKIETNKLLGCFW